MLELKSNDKVVINPYSNLFLMRFWHMEYLIKKR